MPVDGDAHGIRQHGIPEHANRRRARRRANTAVPDLAVEVVAEGFEHGWDIGFLPDGRALVTERPGRISLVSGLREGARRTHGAGRPRRRVRRRARAA